MLPGFALGLALLETESGLEVIYIVPSEPAQQAGIQSGDLITSINGKELKTIKEFRGYPLAGG